MTVRRADSHTLTHQPRKLRAGYRGTAATDSCRWLCSLPVAVYCASVNILTQSVRSQAAFLQGGTYIVTSAVRSIVVTSCAAGCAGCASCANQLVLPCVVHARGCPCTSCSNKPSRAAKHCPPGCDCPACSHHAPGSPCVMCDSDGC
eukprot:4666979-Prymnesium_polylepis.1